MEDPTLTAKAEAFKNKGNDEFKRGQFNAAIEQYSDAIECCPTNPAYYTNRCIAYIKLEKFEPAMRDCQLALQADPKFCKAYNRMSKCYIALGNLYEASVALQKSCALEPGNPINKKDQKHLSDLKITESLVKKAITAENFDKAVTSLSNLLEFCTQSVDHHCLKIECMLKAYQFDQANKFSAEIMKKEGPLQTNPRILCWRGKCLIYIGADILGKKHFQQALNYDPDLKECQICMKKLKKSLRLKEEATEVFKAGDFKEAITKFQECVEIDPQNGHFNSTLLLNISIAYEKLGDRGLKLEALNHALKYNPKYAKALVRRGDHYAQQEEYMEAIKDYAEAQDYDASGNNVVGKLKDAQAKQKQSKRKDYYKLLGITKGASDAEVRKNYKKMSLKYHPDKNNNGSEEEKRKADKMFKDVNEAKSVLLDKDKRELYDQGHDLEDINSGKAGGGGGGMGGMDPNDIFRMFMGGGGGGGGGGMGGMGGRQGRGGGNPNQGFTFNFG